MRFIEKSYIKSHIIIRYHLLNLSKKINKMVYSIQNSVECFLLMKFKMIKIKNC